MRATVLLCIGALIAGCGSDPTGDIFTMEGIVRGQITSPDGAPVANAWVALDGAYPLSNGNTSPVYDSTQSDAAGQYLGTLAVVNMPDTLIAVSLRIWPPASSGLAPALVGGFGLRLTAAPAQDTLLLDIQLSF